MFCPKCGLQNTDETKYCRSCGADLSNVLAIVDGKLPVPRRQAEKHIQFYSLGIRGLLLGIGFLAISGLSFAFKTPNTFLWLFMLAPAFFFLSAGISRLIQARGIKALSKSNEITLPGANTALLPGQADYMKPPRSIYDTDDLIGRPLSVTEHTTTHLQMDPDGETLALPKK